MSGTGAAGMRRTVGYGAVTGGSFTPRIVCYSWGPRKLSVEKRNGGRTAGPGQHAMAFIAYLFAGPVPVIAIILMTNGFDRGLNVFAASALLLSFIAAPGPLLCGILANGLYLRDLRERLSVVRSFQDGDPQKEKYIRSCTGIDRRYAALGIALLAGAFFALMYYLATTCDPVGVFRLFLHKYMPTVFPRPLNVYHS